MTPNSNNFIEYILLDDIVIFEFYQGTIVEIHVALIFQNPE